MTATRSAKRRNRNIVAALLALLLGIGGGVFASTLGGDDEAAAGEIILSPAADVGPDPFSPDPFAAAPDPTLAQPATAVTTPITVASSQTLTGNAGGEPGLYGGTKDKAACDPQKIVDFLAANPDKAAAWVAALDADPDVKFADGRRLTVDLIPEYIGTLTPLVLRDDIRVTNHGFKAGKPTKLQSVLQKGSAVLVDDHGVPRVKCYCGNPLLPPTASKAKPIYTGKKWPDFDPGKVTVITINKTVITNFVVTDPKTGTTFTLPAGSKVTIPGATPTTSTTAAPTTTGATTTAVPTTAPPTTAAPTTAAPTTAAPAAGPPTISGSYTDPDGDGKGKVTHDGADQANTVFTGDGSSGTFSGNICALPGTPIDVTLFDQRGQASATATVTT